MNYYDVVQRKSKIYFFEPFSKKIKEGENVQAEIKLSPELEDALKAAINTAAQKIVDDSKSKNNKWPMYMNKGTAAKYLGISYNTLSTWMDEEKVPYKHIAGSYRFNRNDLDKFMATE